ncbi:MAG: ribonuclease HI family protein [Anaerolineae bacterium]|nr:ribonuclease HI family protein [Anaerolineae bacterium]
MYILHFDGLFKTAAEIQQLPHDCGFLSYGWFVERSGQVIAHGLGTYLRRKSASSSVAEYLAMIEGLEALIDLNACDEPVSVIGDAKSVIDQMQGTTGVTSGDIRPLYDRACKLAEQFVHLQWEWTPREYNKLADALTRRAIHQMRAAKDSYHKGIRSLAPNHGAQKANETCLMGVTVIRAM